MGSAPEQAFVEVADRVAPSVVVIEVAHPVVSAADSLDLQNHPNLENLPEDLRRQMEEFFKQQQPEGVLSPLLLPKIPNDQKIALMARAPE